MKKILKFIDEVDIVLQEKYSYDSKKELALARTVKLMEEVGELSSEILSTAGQQRREKLDLSNLESLEGEIADVLITALLVGKSLDIDIQKALDNKILKIENRFKK